MRLALVVLVACGPGQPTEPTHNRVPLPAVPTDTDGDGIPDDRDACPGQPEDYDMFEDQDGCPDPDNDGDGVPDDVDLCPYTPGRERGCIVRCRVVVTDVDECLVVSTITHDARGEPSPQAIASIVSTVATHPSVRGLEVIGAHPERLGTVLRERLPRLEIVETRRADMGSVSAAKIAKQRYGPGKFSETECTGWGAVYTPKRARDCTR